MMEGYNVLGKRRYLTLLKFLCLFGGLYIFIGRNAEFTGRNYKYVLYEDRLHITAKVPPQLNFVNSKERIFDTSQLNTRKDESIHVLISAYMRGGSTVGADLLTGEQGVSRFFFYEPLFTMSTYGYFTGDNQLCDTLKPTCRKTNDSKDITGISSFIRASDAEIPSETIHRLLSDIYSCQIDETFYDVIKDGVTEHFAGFSWKPYADCKSNIGKLAYIPKVRSHCLKSKIRVTKVLRLRLDVTQSLLESDSALKIVHIFRDSRAIMCSRALKTPWYPLYLVGNYINFTENARSLCMKMTEDYKAGKQLMTSFPGRVRLIRYEDLFYDMALVDGIKSELGIKPISGNITTTYSWVDNNSPVDFKPWMIWRKLLSPLRKKILDELCNSVYKDHGYIQLSTVDLLNMTKLTFIPEFDIR